MIRGVVIVSLVTLALGGPAHAQSLWRDEAPGGQLFADAKARRVNDVLTVVVVEESASSRSANTSTGKSTSRTAGVNRFPSIVDPLSKKAFGGKPPSEILQNGLSFDISGQASHEGKGAIERTDRVSGQVAARVVRVLENGNLVIEGRRAVLVNDESQLITVTGIVRPQDITGANTVLSNQIADAEIKMTGKGVLADAQRPGLLYRMLDWLGLF